MGVSALRAEGFGATERWCAAKKAALLAGRSRGDEWRAGERHKSQLARADTPHREPVVLVVVVGIQATTIVVQVVLVVAIVRGSRPPVAVGASIVERAIVVVPTKDRRESGAYGCQRQVAGGLRQDR